MRSKSRFFDYVSIYLWTHICPPPPPPEDSSGANDVIMTMISFICKQNGISCSGIARKQFLLSERPKRVTEVKVIRKMTWKAFQDIIPGRRV